MKIDISYGILNKCTNIITFHMVVKEWFLSLWKLALPVTLGAAFPNASSAQSAGAGGGRERMPPPPPAVRPSLTTLGCSEPGQQLVCGRALWPSASQNAELLLCSFHRNRGPSLSSFVKGAWRGKQQWIRPSFYSLSKGQAFFCGWKWPMTHCGHQRDGLSARPSCQGCAEHILYLAFLWPSHPGLSLMCFISPPAWHSPPTHPACTRPWTILTPFLWGKPSRPCQMWSGWFSPMNQVPNPNWVQLVTAQRGTKSPASMHVQSHYRTVLTLLCGFWSLADGLLMIHLPSIDSEQTCWPPTMCHALL